MGPDDAEVLERFPSVRLDHLNKRYYQGLLRRELLASRCRACGTWHTPGVDYSGGFPLAAIELAEQSGLRVEATVVDCQRDRLRIGLEVELTWIDRDGAPWPAFRPSGTSS